MYDPLSFDYELLHGQRVVSIRGRELQRSQNGFAACEEVAICLERDALIISVNVDTDEIILRKEDDLASLSSDQWQDLEMLSKYIGQDLGWCWVGRNYRGYADLFLLSFEAVEPHLAFCGAASVVWFYEMRKL